MEYVNQYHVHKKQHSINYLLLTEIPLQLYGGDGFKILQKFVYKNDMTTDKNKN